MIEVLILIPSAVAVLLLGMEKSGRLRGRFPEFPPWPSWGWTCALVSTYAGQLVLIWYGATHGPGYAPWRAAMPLPVMDLGAARVDELAVLMLVCGLLQTIALVALYRRLPHIAVAIAGAAALLVLSLLSPALASADAYSNVGYALLGASSYRPPAAAFAHGEFSWIELWWGSPMVPSPYGPLWTLLDRAVTLPLPTLIGKILALRVFCALVLAAWIAALRALGMPARVVAVAALNPALFLQFVANAHNDILAVLIVTLAALAVRRNWMPATLGIVTAAAIKLPYALLALPVLTPIRPRRFRIAVAAGILVAVAAVSWWWGGPAYVHALEYHARHAPQSQAAWRFIAAAAAVLLLVAALLGAPRLRTVVWFVPALGALYPAFLYPWYAIWAVPYALGSRRVLAYLLVWLPFVTVLLDQDLLRVWTLAAVYPLVFVLAVIGSRRHLVTLSLVDSHPSVASVDTSTSCASSKGAHSKG